jgi:hypothetical protein
MPNMPTGAKLFDVVLVVSAIAIMLAVHLG